MDDLRIIELYFARNKQAITETDTKYGKLCRSIACSILNTHEDSEECVNDTYMGVWNAIPPARPHNLRSFVCKVTRNLSLERLELRFFAVGIVGRGHDFCQFEFCVEHDF